MSDVGKIFKLLKNYGSGRRALTRFLPVECVDVVAAGWVTVSTADPSAPPRRATVRRTDLRPWPAQTCRVCYRGAEYREIEWADESATICSECANQSTEPLTQEDDAMASKGRKSEVGSRKKEGGGMAAAVREKKPRGGRDDVDVTQARKTRTRQSTIGDIVPGTIREIEEAADMYCDLRDERLQWGVKEKEAKTHLIEMMKKHGLTNYPYDGRLVQFQAAMDEEVKVKDVKKKARADDETSDDEEE